MKTKCSCGNEHCCHKKIKRKTIFDKKSGRKFIRETCATPDCLKHLGDRLLN
jgi:hypothetical protein